MPFCLRILHVSDLHERVALDWMTEERKRRIRVMAASRYRVLDGSNYFELIEGLRRERPFDLVCFTGDIADWGLEQEYAEATLRIDKILNAAGAARDQLYLVPGNHDIARKQHADSWQKLRDYLGRYPIPVGRWLAGLPPPPGADPDWLDSIGARSGAFWRWLEQDLGRAALLPARSPHGRLGYRVSARVRDLPFAIQIVGLDTAWVAGDDNDARKLRLTDEQINLLARDDRGAPLEGFRLALMHHPLGDLADERSAIMQLSESADLVLHGHQHEPTSETRLDPDRALRVLAAGSLYEGDEGDRWLNSFHTVDVELDDHGRPLRYNVRFFGWSQKGHWHATGAIYKSAPQGVLAIDVSKSAGDSNIAPPDPVWYLVERRQKLDELKEKLLRGKQPALALVGMSGAGKSTLAGAAARDGEVTRAFTGGILWITLGQQRVAILPQIRATLLACGDVGVPPEDIDEGWKRLADALRTRAALLVLDDVWLAADVTPFQRRGSSKVLITTREWAVADAAAAPKLEVEPLTEDEALTLLERRVEHSLSADDRVEAVKVANAVGRLPLSLAAVCVRIEEGDTWQAVRKDLEDEVKRLRALDVSSEATLSVAAAFELSIRTLQADAAEAFALLSLFAENALFTIEAAANLWNVTAEHAEARCRLLRRKELTMQKAAADGRRVYQLHAQQRDAARRMLKLSPQQAHAKLLAQYRCVAEPISRVADDGYIHDHLIWHVIQAGELAELHRVLADERDGRNVWFEARNGRLGGYVDDLLLARQAVRGSWGQELRYVQMLGSVASQSSKVPLALFEALLGRGIWSVERAFGHAIALPSGERGRALCLLLPQLTGPLRRRAFDTMLADIAAAEGARRIWMFQLPCVFVGGEPDRLLALAKQGQDRPKAIAATLRHFVTAERVEVVFAELDGLAREKDLGNHYGLPITVADLVIEMNLLDVLGREDVQRILDLYGRDSWLRSYAAARLGQLGELDEALSITVSLADAERAHALQALAPRLRPSQLASAITAAEQVLDDGLRTPPLANLYARLEEPQRTALLTDLWKNSRKNTHVVPHLPASLVETMSCPESVDARERLIRRLAQLGLTERALGILGAPGRHVCDEFQILAPALSETQIAGLGIHDPSADPCIVGALLPRWIEFGHDAELSALLRSVAREPYALETCIPRLVPVLDDTGILAALAICMPIGDERQRQCCVFQLAAQASQSLAADLLAVPPEELVEHDQLHEIARALPADVALQLRARSSSPLHRLAISAALETWHANEILEDLVSAEEYIDGRFEQINDLPLLEWREEYRRMRAATDYYVGALELAPPRVRAAVEMIGRHVLRHFGLRAPRACVAFRPANQVVAAARKLKGNSAATLATIAAFLQGTHRAKVETMVRDSLQDVSPYSALVKLTDSLELTPALLDLAFDSFKGVDGDLGWTGAHLVALLAKANRTGDALAVLACIPESYENIRMHAHVALALHAPPSARAAYLDKVWERVFALKYSNSDKIGAPLVTQLMSVVLAQPKDAVESLACRALAALARTTRPQLFAYLGAIAPLMRALGGEPGLVECRKAVEDIGRWWP
ncbi:NB-ARC domain-containing protein [Burkholderia ubonensis]|uniref:AAA+ ATPase domain-containing protein n=1 Tax=Burkholderia ubonensis TaxID=101571 RepID=A0ABD4E7S1_9BURK|nr:NB-ARC domain-containing protein [Burkholderia ubonensis]KVN88688.1 hypothetical protein WJ68_05870 [Burkholderia ubonensis]KVZ54950.1 hypothetical protein WL19_07780 [Burkholderia ubonensis]KVZ82103.1 hypothetical protein WL24_16135 [Burkholderia ubonensis]